jgi:single-strand DNA-binding protein
MYHKVVIIGNLGRDPEMKYTPKGTAVTNFSVATTRKWKNPDGSDGEETAWFRVSVWGKMGEACNQFLAKGRQVYIEGTLRPDERGNPRTFQRQDGTWGASFEVHANIIKFLGQRGEKVEGVGVEEPEEPPAGFTEENEIPF